MKGSKCMVLFSYILTILDQTEALGLITNLTLENLDRFRIVCAKALCILETLEVLPCLMSFEVLILFLGYNSFWSALVSTSWFQMLSSFNSFSSYSSQISIMLSLSIISLPFFFVKQFTFTTS